VASIEGGTRYAARTVRYTREEVVFVVATRHAVSDLYRRGRCLSSWLSGTRYTACDIYKRTSVLRSQNETQRMPFLIHGLICCRINYMLQLELIGTFRLDYEYEIEYECEF